MKRSTYKATLEKQGHSAEITINENTVVVIKTRLGFRLMVRTVLTDGRPDMVMAQEFRAEHPSQITFETRHFMNRRVPERKRSGPPMA